MLDLENLGEFAELLTRTVEHRIELATIELAEARDATMASAALILAAGGLLLLSGIVFTLLIAAALWNTPYRLPGLAMLGIVYAAGGCGLLLRAKSRLEGREVFPQTADQLRKDAQCLGEMMRHR